MTAPLRVYWDSCCWIALINQEPGRLHPLEHFYSSARNGECEIWTSTLTLAEVYKIDPEKNAMRSLGDDGLDRIESMFMQDFVKLIPVDIFIGRDARRLLRDVSGLKKCPDAIHLASALRSSVDEMHTYDGKDLLVLDDKYRCRDGRILTICRPLIPQGAIAPQQEQYELFQLLTENQDGEPLHNIQPPDSNDDTSNVDLQESDSVASQEIDTASGDLNSLPLRESGAISEMGYPLPSPNALEVTLTTSDSDNNSVQNLQNRSVPVVNRES